jgi:hypothetical protein
MSTLPKPLPVVLCGKTAAIGGGVASFLQPDYEGACQLYDPKSTVPNHLTIH